MSSRNRFTRSIKPSSLSIFKTKEDFIEMLELFDQDTQYFLETKDNYNEFVRHWQIILAEITKRNWINSFENRLLYHKNLREYKLIAVRRYLDFIWTEFNKRYSNIIDDFEKRTGINIYDLDVSSLSSNQRLYYQKFESEIIENVYSFIGMLQGLINISFFAFESSCKILSALGCYDFSAIFANEQIIQHEEIWKTLKRLAKVDSRSRCEKCLLIDYCRFEINFQSVANAYCFAFKTRLLSDYGDLFYNIFSDFSRSIQKDLENINKYFKNIEKIIRGQRDIEKYCLGW